MLSTCLLVTVHCRMTLLFNLHCSGLKSLLLLNSVSYLKVYTCSIQITVEYVDTVCKSIALFLLQVCFSLPKQILS